MVTCKRRKGSRLGLKGSKFHCDKSYNSAESRRGFHHVNPLNLKMEPASEDDSVFHKNTFFFFSVLNQEAKWEPLTKTKKSCLFCGREESGGGGSRRGLQFSDQFSRSENNLIGSVKDSVRDRGPQLPVLSSPPLLPSCVLLLLWSSRCR